MVKSYYITFGYLGNNKEKIATIISEKLNIKILSMSGGNFGYRFGEIAETISIIDNYLEYDDWWQEENYKNYPILIKVSCTKGKNKEKEEKASYIRDALKSLPDLIEINES
ncbi:P-loop NTPase family protein [Flavobacterium oreochromis]|uniref:Uncharacterized protein n=1 Tax=Flavobacterium columnare TaxID=996 RepID=A0A246GEE9_9FLAO|nr:hypothetical protein [Flavobacterium oreochromis]OWP79763.1 hypothetical protein BWK62_00580 [Flavobacterium oreochromis]